MTCFTRLTVLRSCLGQCTQTHSENVDVDIFFMHTLIDDLCSDSSILPEELATQSVRLKEEQLRREEEKVGGDMDS